MFGLFASQEKKMRANAGNWLEIAERVYHFRRDLLPPAQLDELEARRSELKALVKKNFELYGGAVLAEEFLSGREFDKFQLAVFAQQFFLSP